MATLNETIDKDKEYDGRIPDIKPKEISIVIPVKNNQVGIDKFLSVFFQTQQKQHFPSEIIIIDNNSRRPLVIRDEFKTLAIDIKLLSCKKLGPAAARNLGILNSKGEWVLFCDSDCIPTNSLITGYTNSNTKAIAYAGNVKADNNSWLDGFYNREDILLPRMKPNKNKELVPLYIVTANALVWKKALLKCGCFNETFKNAGGEDVELSTRLWKLGNLYFISESLVLHDYGSGIKDFLKRFFRYGKGNRQIENIHNISMKPGFKKPKKRTPLNYFAKLVQHTIQFLGYLIR
ncbi:MAG: glycosyl transferase [Bacteroidetes bacterium HGW-Bacteroidetes-17]|jgi:glycosyltransferase involved in cell wall biosynthesis|nr:MAG: glycosyl transferase [Bacteroidetes bacterium HGW-Bacteroidetes-17]